MLRLQDPRRPSTRCLTLPMRKTKKKNSGAERLASIYRSTFTAEIYSEPPGGYGGGTPFFNQQVRLETT